MGFPATVMSTLGWVWVWGRSRFPRPATGIIAFTRVLALAEQAHQAALHLSGHFGDVLDRVPPAPVRCRLVCPQRSGAGEGGKRRQLVVPSLRQMISDESGEHIHARVDPVRQLRLLSEVRHP